MNTTYMLKSNLPVYSSVIVVMVVGAVDDVVVGFPKGRSKKIAFFRTLSWIRGEGGGPGVLSFPKCVFLALKTDYFGES